MKTKIFFFLATLMLCCASAFAQSGNNEPLQGDVNEDGIVDVADIAAIIEIIKDQGGEIYYWYVGNDIQQSTSTINVATGTNPGWRKIEETVANVSRYTSSNPLWNGESNPIQTGFTTVGCYLYLPKEYVDAGLGAYSGDGTAGLDNTFQKTSRQTITINSIEYYEYFKSGVYAQFDNIIYKK